MHFLCLHGLGTNSEVLELQTTAIRYGLGSSHTYDFVEGEVPYPMEPGIASLVSPSDTFYAYCDPNSAEDFLSTLSELDEHISSASPPYDAVMGFSQGSCLAATLLLRKSLRGEPLPFKCAVFLSAGMALDWESLERGEVEMYGGRVVDGEKWERGKGAIGIPTAHVWGTKDACAPGQGRLLSELCSAEGREIAVHGGEHSVPGAGVQKDLMAAVGAIERTIKRAEA